MISVGTRVFKCNEKMRKGKRFGRMDHPFLLMKIAIAVMTRIEMITIKGMVSNNEFIGESLTIVVVPPYSVRRWVNVVTPVVVPSPC